MNNVAKELQLEIYNMYKEMYDEDVVFYKLNEKDTPVNKYYNESNSKKFDEGIKLLANIDMKPELDKISLIGQKGIISGQFIVPYLELEKKNLNLSIETLTKGQVQFLNDRYDILNVIPNLSFGNIPVSYVFEIKRCKSNG